MRHILVLIVLLMGAHVLAQTETPTPTPTETPTPTITPAPYYLTAGVYDVNHPFLRYTGNWTVTVDVNNEKTAYTTDGTLEFDFIGESLVIYLVHGVDGDDASICVDQSCSTVNTYAADTLTVPYIISQLPRTKHLASVAVGAPGNNVTLDQVEVFIYGDDEQIVFPTPLPTGTPLQHVYYATIQPDANDPGSAINVAYDFTITASDFVIGALLFLLNGLLLVNLVAYNRKAS